MHEFIAHCTFEDLPVEFSFRLTITPLQRVDCELKLVAKSYGVSYEQATVLFGYELSDFVQRIDELDATLTGEARLTSFDETLVIWLTVVDSARGRIALGVRAWRPSFLTERTRGDAERPGLGCQFFGLEFDQTYLRQLSLTIHRFLIEEKPSLESPWQ